MAGQNSFSVTAGTTKIYRIDKQPNITEYIWAVYTDSYLTLLADTNDVALTSLGAGRENEIQVTWNVTGTFYLSVTVIDNLGCKNRTAFVFNSTNINTVVAIQDTATITTTQLLRVLDNDFDPDEGDINPASIVIMKYKDFAGPYHGNVNVNKDGTITFIPEVRYEGLDSFVYRISDDVHPNTAYDTAIVRLNIIWDDKLVAVNDYFWTYKDQPKTFDISYNDKDPDGILDLTSVKILDDTKNGTTSIGVDGKVKYTPSNGFVGLDSFYYQICNTAKPPDCDEAWTFINVVENLQIIANRDDATIGSSKDVIIPVLINDFDPEGLIDTTSLSIFGSPKHGTVTILVDGTIHYVSASKVDQLDSFIYRICDSSFPVTCDTAIVYIHPAENQQLIAVRDDATSGGEEVVISVLNNDFDPEGLIDTTSLTIVDYPEHSIVTILADGTIKYIPDAGVTGLDSFVYRVCDSGSPVTCDTAIVYVIVVRNSKLIAIRDDVTIGEDEDVIIPVLKNDFDPEGLIDTTSLAIVDNPEHGTVNILTNGTINYTPENGTAGLDSFIYRLCDSGSPVTCDTAIVYVNVVPKNLAVVANLDRVITPENETVVISILNNDYDPDGVIDTLSLVITKQPSNGNVTILTDGTLSYLPDNGFAGVDSLIYRICDNGPVVTCDTALVVISVSNNMPPVAIDDIYNVVNGITNTWEVTLNDYDLDDGLDSASVQIINGASHGTATVNPANGQITFLAENCFFGVDSLTYVVFDTERNISNAATVFITITIDLTLDSDGDGAHNVTEDINGNGTPCDDDTDNDGIPNYLDIDDDGDGVLSITEDWNRSGDPSDDDTDRDGTPNYLDTDDDDDSILTKNEDPNHDGNYMDDDTDGNGIINLLDPNDDGDWLMTINETGDLDSNGVPDYLEVWNPHAQKDSVSLWIDQIANIPVLENDSTRMDGRTLIIIENPINGYARVNESDWTITYSPESEYAGADSFYYEVCDYYGVCDTAMVVVNIENLEFPQLFTPNGDGKNDNYVIGGIESYPNNRFIVYNRWGNKVYDKAGYLNEWDGWANVKFVLGSKELPVGVYYYILRYNEVREKAGALFLER
jgi:gliding motility-associated-like protein